MAALVETNPLPLPNKRRLENHVFFFMVDSRNHSRFLRSQRCYEIEPRHLFKGRFDGFNFAGSGIRLRDIPAGVPRERLLSLTGHRLAPSARLRRQELAAEALPTRGDVSLSPISSCDFGG